MVGKKWRNGGSLVAHRDSLDGCAMIKLMEAREVMPYTLRCYLFNMASRSLTSFSSSSCC